MSAMLHSRVRMDSAGHHQPQLGLGNPVWLNVTDDAPIIHDQKAVTKGQNFLQFRRYQQDAYASVTQLQQLAMNELNSANVNATGWLGYEQKFWRQLKLPSDDKLLLIPSRQ